MNPSGTQSKNPLDAFVKTIYNRAISKDVMPFLPKDPAARKLQVMGLKIAGDFGIVIALPVVIFVIIGQWIDGRYGTSPWATVAAFALAAPLSARIIYQKTKAYTQEYKQLLAELYKDKKNDADNQKH